MTQKKVYVLLESNNAMFSSIIKNTPSFLLLFLFLVILSGCASSIRKDINLYENRISSSDYSINKSETFLSNHPDVFVNGDCVKPPFESKPDPFCASRDEAKEYAVSYCVLPFGCDAAMMIDDELDTFSKRFLASEMCSQTVNALRKKGYDPDDTMINLLESGADSLCEKKSDGFFSFLGKVMGCTMSLSVKLAKISAFSNCVDNHANDCYQKYRDWLYRPERMNQTCKEHLENIAYEKEKIQEYNSVITEKKDTLTWKLFGDD